MSNNSDNDKARETKVYPIDLAQKITIIKGTSGADPKVPHLVSGTKIPSTQGQIIGHAVGLMRSATQILPQGIATSQPQLASSVQTNVGAVGSPSAPIIQGTQIINQGSQNSGTVVGNTVRALPTTVTQISYRRDCNFGQILGLPIQQHTQLATAVSIPSVRPQTTVTTQPVTTAKQLTTSYHVPRGPAAVASLAVPRGSAGPRVPTPSPTPNWSSGGPQCYVSRAPRPTHTLQVTAQRSSLRQVSPQSTTATVVARVVRPSNTPSPQRTPPPQAIQSVSTVRPPPTKVVPLVQRNYQQVKVVGVATLGVRPTISPRAVGNTYCYEVSSGIAPAQPSSAAPPISTQHIVTTVSPHLQQPTSVQSISSTSVVTQTPSPLIVQQVSIPQQQTMGHQSSLAHSAIVQQSQTNLSHQNNLPIQLSQQVQQQSHAQPTSIIHQPTLGHQVSHKSQLNQTSLTQLSNIAHQSNLVQMNSSQHSVVNQQPSVVQQVTSISSLGQTPISQLSHQPLSTVNLQAHNQMTSFVGTIGNSNNDMSRPPSSPGGPQRPSILRKRDNDGSPMKNLSIPPPPISTSPPPSPGGSTTVSAASSPGPEDDEPPLPMFTQKPHPQHSQTPHHQTSSMTQIITQHSITPNTQTILQTVLQPPLHQNDQQSYNNCSPRKKPRKQLLPSETRNPRGEECEFPPEGNSNINNVQATILSPPHAASPPVTQPQPVEREKPPRRALLGAGWKCGWKATALHFTRPSDVRRREERRPSVVELAAQRHVQQKANGWKIHHLTAQMDDLCELENNALETTANILKMLESKPHVDHHRVLELLKGNIQRTKLVSEGVGEAKANILRVFQHKSHVSDILARQADKRCFKKHRNQC